MYGYPTMLWGWLDMANNDNLPPPLDVHLIASLFSIGVCCVRAAFVFCDDAPPTLYRFFYVSACEKKTLLCCAQCVCI